MSMSLKYNLAVVTSQYERDGQTKNRYKTIGKVLVDDNGGEMYLLDRTFNPAGCPGDRDSVILSRFEPGNVNDGASRQPGSGFDDGKIPF